ncbi:MAG TPA: nitrilase-related carbon-nitrogen hydrolase [Chloroflexaceae bacterium]|nr:nitrilase-related carbon-nitrogen hydrolase [Chloroflexaceae bacterium]
MERPAYPIADRRPWLWLVTGALIGLFTYGAWLVPPLVWVAPIFTMRFMRAQPVLRGFALALPVTAAMLAVLLRGVVPIPGVGFAIFVVVGAAMGLVPYLLDRVLAPRLPAFAATLVFPLAMVALELLNAQGEWGTWGATAYTQAGILPLAQLASVAGLWGVVFLISWPASLVNWAWEQGWRWERVRAGALLYAGLLALSLGFGYARLATATTQATVRVAGIPSDQPSLVSRDETHGELIGRVIAGAADPADRDAARALFEAGNARLLERSADEAGAGARIVFWAEGNGTVLKDDEAALVERGRALAREQGIYLGMALAVLTPGAERPLENKIVLVTPAGEIGFEYLKAFPVPGGEAAGSVLGEARLPTLDTPYGRIGAVICFDMDHHAYIRQAAAQGVDILFAPANTWPEVAETHAAMARVRAIENGVSLLRPASNGVSIAADPYGRTLARSDSWQTEGGALVASLPARAVPTIYGRIGDAPAYAAVAALALLAAWAIARGLQRRAVARRQSSPA